MQVTETIKYVGVNDHEIDLFEGQYDVRENGMAYNSYVIFGEKVILLMLILLMSGLVISILFWQIALRATSLCIIWSLTILPVSLLSWSAIPRRNLLHQKWLSK